MEIDNELPDEQLIALITAKYTRHNLLAVKYKAMLDAFSTATGEQTSLPPATIAPTTVTPNTHAVNGATTRKTFESIIVEIFSDGRPRNVHELISEHHKITGQVIKRKDFASKLSMRSKTGKILNIEYPGLPTEKRYWWGLKEWIDGEDFKEEFKSRMKGNLVTQTSFMEQ